MDRDPKEFEALIAPQEAQGEFVLEGPEYARVKAGPTPGTAVWYNKKSFSLIHSQPNGPGLFSPELIDRLVAGYGLLMPLYDYFVTLDPDPAPVRP